MRVLWITNIPIAKHCEVTKTPQMTGGWMTAALEMLKGNNSIEICIATTWPVKKKTVIKELNINYALLPGGYPIKYNPNKKSNVEEWKQLVSQFNPDIIQIWGTEFAHSLGCIRHIKEVPIIVYIQGIMSQLAKEYLAGMNIKELQKAISLRDILKRDSIKQQQKKFYKRAINEKEILILSKGVIIENIWAKIHCLAINPDLNIYTSQLPINKVFYNSKWEYQEIEKYSIMCNASGYPIKGLHILLRALFLIKKKYPEAKLKIPGPRMIIKPTIKQRIFNTGYLNYLADIIKKLDLEENLSFLGELTPEQMAANMKKSHVFVVPSALENHSSTLREAMIIGTPSITSFVGGVPEIITNGKNAFIYRFEEYEIIAHYVSEIFSSRRLAETISKNGIKSMRENHDPKLLNNDFINIYNAILEKASLNKPC